MRTRCPNCRQAVEVLDDDPLVEISCESCGSSFSLVTGRTETYGAGRTQSIGHFDLLEELGRGAFGSVWKAHDRELDRIVAIKIPRHEQLDDFEVERFLREARAAAQLSHPGIVSIHEVAREAGQIYIITDFVQGATLGDWADARAPSIREAAAMVARIADALGHAHEHGVVHRDLKPANILIDGAGDPHLTDFGLAKRDAGEITMTVEGQILGTPSYMSPEQARGMAHGVDARADIYSLGVILFELLTGELPFRGSSRMVIVQILNDEPPSPRKFKAGIPRDLETIALKCLAKEPSRRYQTAAELAADLRRWMGGEPILARPVGRVERLWRWSRRNPKVAWLAASVAALLLMVAVLSTVFAVKQNRLAESERLARSEAEGYLKLTLRAIDELLTEVGQQELKDIPHAESVRKSLLAKAQSFYEELLGARPADPSLRLEFGRAQHNLGYVLSELDQHGEAEQAFRQAIATLEQLTDEFPDTPEYRHHLARAHTFLAEVLREMRGRAGEAERHYRAALALQRDLVERHDDDADHLRELTRTWNNLGILLMDTGRARQARDAFDESIAGLTKLTRRDAFDESELTRRDASNAKYGGDLARSYLNRGMLLGDRAETDEDARADYERSISVLRTLIDREPRNREYRRKLATVEINLGNLLWRMALRSQDDKERQQTLLRRSKESLETGVAMFQGLRDSFPDIPRYSRESANALNSLANVLPDLGEMEKAGEAWDRALAILGETAARFPEYTRAEPEYQSVWGVVLGARAWYDRETGDPQQAVNRLEDAIKRQSRAVEGNPVNPRFRKQLANHYTFLAETLIGQGRIDEAAARLKTAVRDGFVSLSDLKAPVFEPLLSRDDFRASGRR